MSETNPATTKQFAFKPLHNYVVLTLEEAPDLHGSIKIPEIAKEKPETGVVLAIGPECDQVHVGDRVSYLKHSGRPIDVAGRKCQYMREVEIVGILID